MALRKLRLVAFRKLRLEAFPSHHGPQGFIFCVSTMYATAPTSFKQQQQDETEHVLLCAQFLQIRAKPIWSGWNLPPRVHEHCKAPRALQS